ncbi:MAG: inositol monophosphatase family protein [Gaiellales bacterium]
MIEVPDPQALRGLAEHAARETGRLLLQHAERGLRGLDTKSTATDMVSDADREAEELLQAILLDARPLDGLLGEEGAGVEGVTGLRWVVDPLDGTTNFVFGYPQWAVSVAVEDADGPLAGAIYDPSRGELFSAHRRGGATLDGKRIHVRATTEIGQALVATGFGYSSRRRTAQAEQVARVIGEIRDIRRGGAAAIDLAWVACGRLDGYWESGLNPWDWAAGSLLVSEAGGRWSCAPGPLDADQAIAACPGVFDHLSALVA